MARVEFLSASPFAMLGGSVGGSIAIEFDKPTKVQEILLSLTGREHSQVTVQQGNTAMPIQQDVVFLNQAVSLRSQVPFQDPEHAAPGTYQLPFRFEIPAVAPPSLQTAPETEDFGHIERVVDGLFVDYTLEIKVDIPFWIDPLRKHRFQVYPPLRVLGGLPQSSNVAAPNGLRLSVAPIDPTHPWIGPGETFPLGYTIQNPEGKVLKDLTVQLVRLVDYQIRGYTRSDRATFGNSGVGIQGNAPLYQGRMDLAIPNAPGMVNPGMGNLFRCTWAIEMALGVHMGFDLKFEVPLMPPVLAVPTPPPPPAPGFTPPGAPPYGGPRPGYP